MGKGKRLRELKISSVVSNTVLTEKVEPTIKNMNGLTRIKASEAPERNRAQRRKDERDDRHEEALADLHPTNRTIWGRIPRQAFQRIRVMKREMGEVMSIGKARMVDSRARRATKRVEQ